MKMPKISQNSFKKKLKCQQQQKSEKEKKKSVKITFFSKNLKFMTKKNLIKNKIKMLLSHFCQLMRLVFNQSSSVHPVSELRGVARASQAKDEQRTDILLFNIGNKLCIQHEAYSFVNGVPM